MGSGIRQDIADIPPGSRLLVAVSALIFVTLSLSALVALALSFKAFLAG